MCTPNHIFFLSICIWYVVALHSTNNKIPSVNSPQGMGTIIDLCTQRSMAQFITHSSWFGLAEFYIKFRGSRSPHAWCQQDCFYLWWNFHMRVFMSLDWTHCSMHALHSPACCIVAGFICSLNVTWWYLNGRSRPRNTLQSIHDALELFEVAQFQ